MSKNSVFPCADQIHSVEHPTYGTLEFYEHKGQILSPATTLSKFMGRHYSFPLTRARTFSIEPTKLRPTPDKDRVYTFDEEQSVEIFSTDVRNNQIPSAIKDFQAVVAGLKPVQSTTSTNVPTSFLDDLGDDSQDVQVERVVGQSFGTPTPTTPATTMELPIITPEWVLNKWSELAPDVQMSIYQDLVKPALNRKLIEALI